MWTIRLQKSIYRGCTLLCRPSLRLELGWIKYMGSWMLKRFYEEKFVDVEGCCKETWAEVISVGGRRGLRNWRGVRGRLYCLFYEQGWGWREREDWENVELADLDLCWRPDIVPLYLSSCSRLLSATDLLLFLERLDLMEESVTSPDASFPIQLSGLHFSVQASQHFQLSDMRRDGDLLAGTLVGDVCFLEEQE